MEADERAQAEGNRAGANRPARVLIVDADENCRRMYSTMLTHRGFPVEAAADCGAAIAEARTGVVRVIVIDPVECDREQLAELRGLTAARGIPVVALTSRVTEPELDAIRGDGYRAVLLKPVLPSQVADAVEQALDGGSRPEAS